jgi:DNA-binding transcriptional LysR family regulator
MVGIMVSNLRALDLNLLVTLDVLLAELNVTRAAKRLAFSQPAVSVHLAKLRAMFGDPLLLPGPRGMRATARGEALRAPVRQALQAVERAVAPVQAFEPARATQTWRVAASDYGASTILLPALRALRTQAPGTRLAVLGLEPARLARQAEQGDLDLGFHTSDDAPASLHRRALFTERYVLVSRPGHPRLKRRPSVAQFCALDHVIVSPDGGGFRGVTDRVLAERGLARRVVLSVPHFLLLPAVLAATDLVAMLPERLVRAPHGLRVVEPPVAVPGYEMAMLWHDRSHRDPAHHWLRETIIAAL